MINSRFNGIFFLVFRIHKLMVFQNYLDLYVWMLVLEFVPYKSVYILFYSKVNQDTSQHSHYLNSIPTLYNGIF